MPVCLLGQSADKQNFWGQLQYALKQLHRRIAILPINSTAKCHNWKCAGG
jgi:hypothetical protein